jgi:hypothetical protein
MISFQASFVLTLTMIAGIAFTSGAIIGFYKSQELKFLNTILLISGLILQAITPFAVFYGAYTR